MRAEQAVKDDAGWSNFQGFEDRPTQPELVRLVFHAKASPGYPEPPLSSRPERSDEPRSRAAIWVPGRARRLARDDRRGAREHSAPSNVMPTQVGTQSTVYSPHVETCLGPGLRRDDGGAWWKRRSPKSPFRGLSGRRRHSALTPSYGSQKPTAGRYREGTSK
jgi:hypothetical protein